MPKIAALLGGCIALLFMSAHAFADEEAVSDACWKLAGSEPKKVQAFVAQELRKAKTPALKGHLHACRGWVHENVDGRINEAAADYEQAVVLTERSGDKGALADALVLRGELRHYRGQFDAAIEDLQKSYAYGETPKQKRYALNAIANLYADRRVGAYDRAIEYYRQVLAFNERARDEAGIATAHYNIAATLDTKGDLVNALAAYERALALEQKRGDATSIADVQRALGVTLNKLGRSAEALAVLEPALAQFLKNEDAESIAQARLARGSVLIRLGRRNEGLRDLEAARAHFQASGSNRFLEKTEEERAKAFAALGNWRGAYDARGAQMAVREKLSERARDEHVSRLRVQFETEKKEQENRALMRIRQLQRVAIGLGAIIIVFLFYLALRHLATARRMRDLALTDELTKLPNRRHVLTFAEEQLKAARAEGKSFSMLALDIDHFKRINDAYGHDAGDVVLRRVAETCQTMLRQHDKMGRTGGEEFMVVLPDTDAGRAADVAERLRVAVEVTDFNDISDGLRITISIGVSEWSTNDDFSAVAKRADDLLYRAKETGRNRVAFA
ncbi:MAG TPA: diguanylate cyclase [Thermoanaerobaculia bacterium]|nr:diguanylate cyclase [Thermoanaerobaculia bacterium]